MVIGVVMVGCASCLLQKGFEPSVFSKTQHSESEFEDQLIKEYYLWGCFSQNREVVSVKVIQNKQTGQCEGYGFIELATRAAAERIQQTSNGTLMPNPEQNFRMNWATLGAGSYILWMLVMAPAGSAVTGLARLIMIV